MSDFHTEELSKCNFYPLILREISVLTELHLGRMRYRFTYEPPQPNSPSEIFLHQDQSSNRRCIGTRNAPRHSNGNYEGTRAQARVWMGFYTAPTPPTRAVPTIPSEMKGAHPQPTWVPRIFKDFNARNKGRRRTTPPNLFAMQWEK